MSLAQIKEEEGREGEKEGEGSVCDPGEKVNRGIGGDIGRGGQFGTGSGQLSFPMQ